MATTAQSTKPPRYNLLKDFGDSTEVDDLSYAPHWIVAVIRLGLPLSFDRDVMGSVKVGVTENPTSKPADPLVITTDCISLTVVNTKGSHTKSLTATLKQTNTNYLIEVLPGDWVMAWMVNNKEGYLDLLKRIRGTSTPRDCNLFDDGLKFVGRLNTINKDVVVGPDGGRSVHFSLDAVGFAELDTSFFYDERLATLDFQNANIGSCLARIGYDVGQLFKSSTTTGIQENNVDVLIPTLVDLIVGRGPNRPAGVTVSGGRNGQTPLNASPLNAAADKTPTYAYTIPTTVGTLLGKEQQDASRSVLSYADVLEMLIGVQEYPGDDSDSFVPKLSGESTVNRKICPTKMLGTFLPFMPEFTNKPLWSILQDFLNPVVNEVYTCLRANSDDRVVPTIVLRQIPFTTQKFAPDNQYIKALGSDKGVGDAGPAAPASVPFTRFLSLPRWVMPGVMLTGARVGRSNATRFNFVSVLGATLYSKANVPIFKQITDNPPIMDVIDMQRSGVHPYMTTVNCAVEDEHNGNVGVWQALAADWLVGSQYTLQGMVSSKLVQAPVCEGDNLEWDGVVYHIESVTHSCQTSPKGVKSATTTFMIDNGMRDDPGDDPIYAGFKDGDNTRQDPGISGDEE